MRPPEGVQILAPPFPRGLPWINVSMLRMDQLRGRPVLVEFWDFCRVNSLRTLPYLRAWHERYEGDGLRVVGIHSAGFPPSRPPEAVEAAVARLEVPYPVVVDLHMELWELYGNRGWPARYLWDGDGVLAFYHYGEGAYEETERAVGELLGLDRDPIAPVHPEDAPDALLPAQTADQEGAYSGPYEAGGAWAVLDGQGVVCANGVEVAVDGPGCYRLVEHERHTHGQLSLEIGEGVVCFATCFTPGLP